MVEAKVSTDLQRPSSGPLVAKRGLGTKEACRRYSGGIRMTAGGQN